MGLAGTPEVSPGDHACCTFATDDDQARIVGNFARHGVARGDRIIYLTDSTDEAQVLAFFDEVGLDGKAMLDRGALEILHSSDMDLADGFDRAHMTEDWKQRGAAARADGYRGVSATAEMTWALSWGLDSDALVEYERIVETAFGGGHLAGLCQYDRRRFERDTLHRAEHAHHYTFAVDEAGIAVDYHRLLLHLGGEVRLAGEIDLANVKFLEQLFEDLLEDGDAVVDCGGLTFIDARGCRLLRAARDGEHATGHLVLRNTPEVVERLMGMFDRLEAG